MRIFLFGKDGQFGKALVPLFQPLGKVISVGHEDLDVADSDKLRNMLRTHKPDIVINAAAYTNADQAEIEKEIAWKVKAGAPGIMMEELNQWEGSLVHFSTDYIFDGMKRDPYLEDDHPNLINEYGRLKLGGERLIKGAGNKYLILRTSWVHAADSQNFVSNIVHWSTSQESLRIVEDQIGSPTWARMLAEQTARLLAKYSILLKRVQVYIIAWEKMRSLVMNLHRKSYLQCLPIFESKQSL